MWSGTILNLFRALRRWCFLLYSWGTRADSQEKDGKAVFSWVWARDAYRRRISRRPLPNMVPTARDAAVSNYKQRNARNKCILINWSRVGVLIEQNHQINIFLFTKTVFNRKSVTGAVSKYLAFLAFLRKNIRHGFVIEPRWTIAKCAVARKVGVGVFLAGHYFRRGPPPRSYHNVTNRSEISIQKYAIRERYFLFGFFCTISTSNTSRECLLQKFPKKKNLAFFCNSIL